MLIDLIAVQPHMTDADYLDPERFAAHIQNLAHKARSFRRGDHALVVFPEDLATFLALSDAPPAVREVQSLDDAFRIIGQARLREILAAMIRHRTLSLKTAFFLLSASKVWSAWHRAMRDAAKSLEATVVAGSALVPENRWGPDEPQFEPASARVHNLSLVFGPDGHVVAVTRKHNLVPTQEDHLGLTPGPLAPSLFWVGPLRAGNAICYDAFRVPHTDHEPGFHSLVPLLAGHGAAVIAQPSANPWWWNDPWVFPRPLPLTRRQQWEAEGLKSAMETAPAIRAGVNPQLLMRLFDIHFDGQSAIYLRRGEEVVTAVEAPHSQPHASSETIIAVSLPFYAKSSILGQEEDVVDS